MRGLEDRDEIWIPPFFRPLILSVTTERDTTGSSWVFLVFPGFSWFFPYFIFHSNLQTFGLQSNIGGSSFRDTKHGGDVINGSREIRMRGDDKNG